jgi:hypothetical protein
MSKQKYTSIPQAHVDNLYKKIAVLEKEAEWLFDFALGYTNAPFLTECLEGVRRKASK